MIKLLVLGNLGADAQVKQFKNGTHVTFSVAHADKYMKDGQEIKETTWVSCMMKIKEGSSLPQYLTKGTKVYCEGVPRVSTWSTQSGETRADLSMTVFTLELVSRGNEQQVQDDDAPPF